MHIALKGCSPPHSNEPVQFWIGFGLVLDWFWIGFGLVLDWY